MATAIQTALLALLLLVPGLIVVRETQRAAVRETTVALSPSQFPELYETQPSWDCGDGQTSS